MDRIIVDHSAYERHQSPVLTAAQAEAAVTEQDYFNFIHNGVGFAVVSVNCRCGNPHEVRVNATLTQTGEVKTTSIFI